MTFQTNSSTQISASGSAGSTGQHGYWDGRKRDHRHHGHPVQPEGWRPGARGLLRSVFGHADGDPRGDDALGRRQHRHLRHDGLGEHVRQHRDDRQHDRLDLRSTGHDAAAPPARPMARRVHRSTGTTGTGSTGSTYGNTGTTAQHDRLDGTTGTTGSRTGTGSTYAATGTSGSTTGSTYGTTGSTGTYGTARPAPRCRRVRPRRPAPQHDRLHVRRRRNHHVPHDQQHEPAERACGLRGSHGQHCDRRDDERSRDVTPREHHAVHVGRAHGDAVHLHPGDTRHGLLHRHRCGPEREPDRR
jgi:hypothetical protein